MKRKLILLLFVAIAAALVCFFAFAQEAAPPDEPPAEAGEAAGDGDTGESDATEAPDGAEELTAEAAEELAGAETEEAAETADSEAPVMALGSAGLFDPSTVKIPSNIEFKDLPRDAGKAVALSWDVAPVDFKSREAAMLAKEEPIHFIFQVNGTKVIEFDDVAKFAKSMADSPLYWGFSKSLSSRKWLQIEDEGFKPGTEVTLQIGVVPPYLEQEYAAAKAKIGGIKKMKFDLAVAKNSKTLESMRRKRQVKLEEFDATIADLTQQIESLGYTEEEAQAEWDAVRAQVYYHPERYTTVTETGLYNPAKTNNLIFSFIFGAVVLLFIARARRDRTLFIRRINGLEAVDEAIGRATEMGKPILYLTGMTSLADLATLAAINILGEVAKKIAEYESDLIVPCRDPVVMTVNQETVKEAYTQAGRPDRYNEDKVFFLTEDQFSYTASVNGIMLRDKPAANFFMGYYYAESLLLAETGAMTGAIQIAGTDSLAQLPFFITACDYTLIGEELYAASAYLSREPLLLGSLKGQDFGKLFLMVVILFGTILVSIGAWTHTDMFDIIQHIFTAL